MLYYKKFVSYRHKKYMGKQMITMYSKEYYGEVIQLDPHPKYLNICVVIWWYKIEQIIYPLSWRIIANCIELFRICWTFASCNLCEPHVNMWHADLIKLKHFPRHWPFVRGIHRSTKLWCFLGSAPEQKVGQTIETRVIWDAIVLIMTSL